jgi:hypothetical protein
MTDGDILELVSQAFADSPRPEHFTEYWHCSECEEHDELLRSRNLDTLTMEDIDNPCWDPICFLTPEGYRYYFPALVRLSLESAENSYWDQLIHYIPTVIDRRFSLFNHQQKQAVLHFLHHIRDAHKELIGEHEDDLEEAIQRWEASIKK